MVFLFFSLPPPSLPFEEAGLIMSFQLSPSLFVFGHAITLHAMAVWLIQRPLHVI
jgi:hypothetical protein